jgi:hypothetical protein
MKQVHISDRQNSFIFYLVHQLKGHTEAARLAGFAAPWQSAFTLTQSPRIIAKIRQERNKVYQTELASNTVQTLKEIMKDTDAPASARIAAARRSLELAGDIGKHSQSQRNYEQNSAEMTPEELSAIIDRWEGEKVAIATDNTCLIKNVFDL